MSDNADQVDGDLEQAAGHQGGVAGRQNTTEAIEARAGRDGDALGRGGQDGHEDQGVEARADDQGEGVNRHGLHGVGRDAEQHAEGVGAVQDAEGQRDVGDEFGDADVAQTESSVPDEALDAHHRGHIVRLELLPETAAGLAAGLVCGVLTLDGALALVGAALGLLERLVVDVRQLSELARGFDEVRARLLHVVLVAHHALRVGAGRVGLGLAVAGDVHEFRGALRAGTGVVALVVALGHGVLPTVQDLVHVARLVLGPKVHFVGDGVNLSVDVADGAGALVLELLALRHGVPARSDVSRVVALEVRVAAVVDEVRGGAHAGQLRAELGAVDVNVPAGRVDAVARLRRAVLKSVDGDNGAVQVAGELIGDGADDGVELRVLGHVIALSVSGLSTERIGRTARGKQARCLSGAVR